MRILLGLVVAGLVAWQGEAFAASCEAQDQTCTGKAESCEVGDTDCQVEVTTCLTEVGDCFALRADCNAGVKSCRMVDGEHRALTGAEIAARAQDRADFLIRVDPVSPPSAAEIWAALKAKGVLTDADVGR